MKNGGPGDADRPVLALAELLDPFRRLARRSQHRLPLLGQRQTDGGCRERTLGAQEQRLAQAFLQKRDRARQGRLGRAEPCRRLREAARFDNRGQLH